MAIQFLNTVAVDTNVLYVDTSSNRVGIGETNPSQKLHVNGNVIASRYYGNTSTNFYIDPTDITTAAILAGGLEIGHGSSGEYRIEVGEGRTGNGYAYIDFVGDTTYSDYGLRLIRNNSGANTSSQLVHRGTGNLEFKTLDAGAMIFSTTNSERMRITSSGGVGIGTNSPSAKLHVSGGTMRTSNATALLALNSTSSFPTVIVQAEQQGSVSPPMGQLRWDRNPGGVGMQLNYYNGTTENSLRLDGSNFRVINNGSERMRIDSSGNVGIGTSSPSEKLHVAGNVRVTGSFKDSSGDSGIPGQVLSSTGSGTNWINNNTGDITSVIAGSYMTGGGGSGTVTLNANASANPTANTLAARTSSGDIYARLFRATYQNQSTISGAIAFRVNNGSDNYTRYCSSPSAIRTFIGAGTSSFSGSYNDLSNKPTIPTNNNQLTNGAGYITGYSETDTLSSVVARGSSTSSRITAAGLTATSDIRGNGQQLVLNAGESYFYATGQTAEHVYLNAEGGVQIVSSPNNWSSGWAGRRTAVINDSSGNSSLPGNLTLASTEAKINLNSTSSNSTIIIQAQQNGSTSPPLGELRWDNNPGATGMRLIYYSGYSENSLKLDGSNFIVKTTGTERMRVNSSGNVGIGTTNPSSAKLQVESTTSTTSSGIVRLKSKTASSGPFVRVIDFVRSNNSTRGYIAMNPYSVQYNTTSDYRLKRNVTPMENSIDRIKLLKPSRFNWVEGPDDYVVDGFIAHEVQDVVHDAVSGEKDAVDENNEPAYQGIDQSKLVPLLTAALQEAIAKIENLETRIQTLENN